GGRGGRGGVGALGCRCRVSSWEVQTCTGTPGQADYRCQTSRYVCQDGYDGATGNVGQDGQPGRDGQLRLVNQLEPLQPENLVQTVPLPRLTAEPLWLSRNLWAPSAGANALLAPGSRVNDSYWEYTGRVEGAIRLDWQAARPLPSLAAASMTAAIQEDGGLSATFSDDIWAEYTTQRHGQAMTVIVTNAVRSQDATRLAWGGLQSNGPALKAIVLDLAGESAYLDTQFRVTLKTSTDDPRDDRRPRYTTVYEGTLTANQVTLASNRFELALGQLPLEGHTLRPGTYAILDITATRSLGANSAQQSLSWQGQI
ncbi:MAG: collagen-like protein, partial [Leptolyngbyaceae cyanobacterium SM2_5_2]|nr:collagen-like protein [Leptolyngbyaceae cyanobacterium SM2_5_2]